jgi:membrane-anchored mycosin MYCP
MMALRRLVTAALVGSSCCLAFLTVPLAAPASAAECADPGQDVKTVPWAQQMLGPSRVWPITRGAGVTVAVLDSGVDAGHAQLAGRVDAGVDALAGSGTANTDCVGTGTQVAGVIVGQSSNGIGFAGVAPAARVLPIRVIAQRGLGNANSTTPAALAKGINTAIDAGAQVIDVAVPTYTDDAALRAAVQRALSRQVLVVAAVGDLGGLNGGNPTPYPAAYNGVLGVGAVNETGARLDSSQYGDYVDLVAPGENILTLQRASGLITVSGTGVASGFVSGVAALVRAHTPALGAVDVARQLTATAAPAAGGPDSPQTGHGIVNPAGAVSDQLVAGGPRPLAPVTRPSAESSPELALSRRWALIGTGIAFCAALLVAAVAAALPRGRRRRWRAGQPPPPRLRTEPEEPGPPVLLFDTESPAK